MLKRPLKMSETMRCQSHILSAVKWLIKNSWSQVIYYSIILGKLLNSMSFSSGWVGVVWQRDETHIENNLKTVCRHECSGLAPPYRESKTKTYAMHFGEHQSIRWFSIFRNSFRNPSLPMLGIIIQYSDGKSSVWTSLPQRSLTLCC